MQSRSEFDRFLDAIRPHILEYLQKKGYNTSTSIRCINPEHHDHNPSMLCARADKCSWTVFCSACGWHGDIFDVYSTLEGTPKKGPEWMKKTVLPLAGLFGIDPPDLSLTFDEEFRQELYRTYEVAAGLLEHDPEKMPPAPRKYVQDKGWTKETLSILDIGTLNSERLNSFIPREEREKFGLQRGDLFSDHNVIFLARDRWGRAIRFFARRPDEKPKFTATNTRDLAVDVWTDAGHLYLAHLLDSALTKATIVEGQPDAASLWQAGFRNVIAPYGSGNFSEHHSDSLGMMGISEATLLYDSDGAGTKGISSLLLKDFAQDGGITYKVALLPGGYDPDDYLREKGKEALSAILTDLGMSSFEYLISRQDPKDGDEAICHALIPYIATTKSEVAREKMARDLSAFLERRVSISAILADVHRNDKEVKNETLAEQGAIIVAASRQAQNNVPQAKQIFREALDRLEEVERQKAPNTSLVRNCLSRVRACKTYEESGLCGGFTMIEGRLQSFADALSGGDWKSGRLLVVGGIQNMGKSSFVDALTWEIISNPNNRAMAYVQTLDDPAEIRFRRFMCNALGDRTLTQNMIASPSRYAEELGVDDVFEKREKAYAKLTEMIASGRLIIEDSTDGRTIAHADRRLRQIRRENQDVNIIHVVDNLHNCDDWAGVEAKDRVSRIVKYERTLCDLYKVTSICTAEYRKGDPSIPGNDEDLADTRALKFEPHLTIHLFSDIVAKGEEEAIWVHRHNGRALPRIMATIGKNKITDVKGSLIFDFFPSSALFFSVPKERALREKKQREEELAIQSKGTGNYE
jgi:DNA primase